MIEIGNPGDLGFDSKFKGWRKGQKEAVRRSVESQERSFLLTSPTGGGKSLIYVAASRLRGTRTLILTSTKGLQDQLKGDFPFLADVRGRVAYSCNADPNYTCEDGPCHWGWNCEMRDHGCQYFDALKAARNSNIVSTNYAFWLTRGGDEDKPIGSFQFLVLDEAHDAPDWICNHLGTEISLKEMEEIDIESKLPTGPSSSWRLWGGRILEFVGRELEIAKKRAKEDPSHGIIKWLRKLASLERKLKKVVRAEDDWVTETNSIKARIDPVWPRDYSEDELFRKIPKIHLTSATATLKTMSLLGIKGEDLDSMEQDSSFPVENRPVYYVPTVRVDHRMGPEDVRKWMLRIRQIVGGRLDRNGVVHTVSYARQALIAEDLRKEHPGLKVVVHNSLSTGREVERFKRLTPPAILVSPSVSTGFDFPNCIEPGTKVLRANLMWENIENLEVGDELLSFEEVLDTIRRGRRWIKSTVEDIHQITLPSYRIELENGDTFVCSGDHGWLVQYCRGGFHWIKTKHIRFGKSSLVPTRIAKILNVWDTDMSYESGYLAAAFDGEGSLYQSFDYRGKGRGVNTISFTQTANIMLFNVIKLLSEKNFEYDIYGKGRTEANPKWKDCFGIRLRNRPALLRFLGQIRPPRLLEKFRVEYLGMLRRMENVRVVDRRKVGKRELIAIKTSSGTFLANGYGSHNSTARYQIISKVAFPDARSLVVKARCHEDKEYAMYLAMMELVQSCGRSTRSEEDYSENLLVDDHFGQWFWPRFRNFSPRWFQESVRYCQTIPPPMKLGR